MRYLARLFCLATLGLPGWGQLAAQPLAPEALASARGDYEKAVQAIDRGQWTEYRSMRPGLEQYPLSIYLDYYQITREPRRVSATAANRFVEASQDTPLTNRFLAHYLTLSSKALVLSVSACGLRVNF